jgi:hypothetical protein
MGSNAGAAVLVATGLLATGCSLGGPSEPAVERLEDNGVTVVVSHRPAWGEGEGWRLSEEALLAIGEDTEDPDYLFSAIFGDPRFLGDDNGLGPFRLASGLIAAGDVGSVEVRFFDESGELVRTAIGEGEGPTELTMLNELHHCQPGYLVAMDHNRNLLAVIDDEGTFHGRHFYQEDVGRPLYTPLACNRDGLLLAMDWGYDLASDRERTLGYYRSQVHIWLLNLEGNVLHDFGEFPGTDRSRTEGGSGPRLLSRKTALALAADRAYIGTADEFEIQVFSLDGTLQQSWRRTPFDTTLDPSRIEALVAEEGPDSSFARQLDYYRRTFEEPPLPETLPAYRRFLLDAADHLWVEHYRPLNRGPRLWSIFAPDGAWLGELEVPEAFDVTDVGEDYVLGVWSDELDEQSIRMYGLVRPE